MRRLYIRPPPFSCHSNISVVFLNVLLHTDISRTERLAQKGWVTHIYHRGNFHLTSDIWYNCEIATPILSFINSWWTTTLISYTFHMQTIWSHITIQSIMHSANRTNFLIVWLFYIPDTYSSGSKYISMGFRLSISNHSRGSLYRFQQEILMPQQYFSRISECSTSYRYCSHRKAE